MIRKILIVSLLSLLIFVECSTKKSRVVFFEYGGHYDTSCAILQGEITEPNLTPNAKDSLYPVVNATIKSIDSTNKVYKTSYTDSKGKFSMSFFNDNTYDLVIAKDGYQTVRIKNLIADTGKTSTMKIILEKDQKIF